MYIRIYMYTYIFIFICIFIYIFLCIFIYIYLPHICNSHTYVHIYHPHIFPLFQKTQRFQFVMRALDGEPARRQQENVRLVQGRWVGQRRTMPALCSVDHLAVGHVEELRDPIPASHDWRQPLQVACSTPR